jgi:hypothetical protein
LAVVKDPLSKTSDIAPSAGRIVLKNVHTELGPAEGFKVGYFFDRIPYLGIEGEGSGFSTPD